MPIVPTRVRPSGSPTGGHCAPRRLSLYRERGARQPWGRALSPCHIGALRHGREVALGLVVCLSGVFTMGAEEGRGLAARWIGIGFGAMLKQVHELGA